DRLKSFSNILLIQSRDVNLTMMIVNPNHLLIMGNIEEPIFTDLTDKYDYLFDQVDAGDRNVLQWFKIPESDDSQAYYYAVRIIEHPQNREVLANLYIGIPQSYFNKLFSTAGEGNIYLLDENDLEIAAKAPHPYLSEDSSITRLRQTIPKVGWKLVYDVPNEQVTGQISRGFLLNLTVIGCSVILFLIFSVFLARGLNKPIYKLKNIAEQYAGGNRFVRFSIKGRDEIAILGKAFNRMLDDINGLFHQVELEQEEKRILELQALFSQIRPHFLLNTLNSIKCKLAVSGDIEHSEMINSLMSLLRAYIRIHEPVALEEEFRLIRDYVRIMQMRSNLDIDFSYELEEPFKHFKVPRLLIQPIVENAIIHGFRKHKQGARIRLIGEQAGDMLQVSITDNGQGLAEPELEKLQHKLQVLDEESGTNEGIGLINVIRRLKLTYGAGAFLSLNNNTNEGLTFMLHIPTHETKEFSNV
ncbi:MAG TPA: histidine kinase, partial [Bacilli bacterium]